MEWKHTYEKKRPEVKKNKKMDIFIFIVYLVTKFHM